MRYYFIYETTNNINGKKYIGKHETDNLNDGYMGSGVNLQRAIKKYGKENFNTIILQYAKNSEELKKLEKEYIAKFNAVESEMYYNIAEGGDGGNTVAGKTEEEIKEIRAKLSEAMKGENNPMYGKHPSEKTIAKLSEAKKGENNPNKRPEVRAKISEAMKGENNPFATKVICIKNNIPKAQFNSMTQSIEWLGKGQYQAISHCCRGKCKTAYGYKWAYITITEL